MRVTTAKRKQPCFAASAKVATVLATVRSLSPIIYRQLALMSYTPGLCGFPVVYRGQTAYPYAVCPL